MARPIWKGSINFGLVNIPVTLETAVREHSISFHRLSKDGGCRLRQKLVCGDTGKEYDFSDTARGVEVGKGEYVLIDQSEIEKLKPAKGKSIEIEQFVELEEIDPVYFDRVYYVTPTDGSAKAYKLLHEAMKQSGRIGIARFVMRDKQYLAAIRVLEDGIVLHTLHYNDEVLPLEDALPGTVSKAKPATAELKIAQQLIEAMTQPLDVTKFVDEYQASLEKLVESKRSGKKMKVFDDHDEEPAPKTINLMEALKKSLAGNKTSKAAAQPRPRRKSA